MRGGVGFVLVVMKNAEVHLRCTQVTPAFTLRPNTNAFGGFSPRSSNAFQVFRAFVDLASQVTCVVAAIDHGGLHGARFPVHLYSAPANVTNVSGPRRPGEQSRRHGPKSFPVLGPLLVADNVHELDLLGSSATRWHSSGGTHIHGPFREDIV